ncbi:helicase [Muribaculaceae bacterium Isolate-110 (HZI)]|nr:helicase [Muribaculaceae bacterium Isolate-110 (HZI)]
MARKKTSSPPSRHNDTEEVIDLDNPEFQRAWELLQYTSQSVFLTGKAGTGKSTFLRYITRHTHKPYVVLAPTGIAAVNAGGQTLHSFFRIPFKPITPEDPDFDRKCLAERMKYPAVLIKLIRKLELIIIDEISMVRADIIDFIDKLLRFYTRNERQPFGGKQLLLVGDVFQLEPVVTGDMRDILRPYYRNFYFFGAHAFSRIRIVPIELRKVYRQNDPEFIALLDRIRAGISTPQDIARLNTRVSVIPTPGKKAAKDFSMTLAARRDMVDHINEAHLNAISKPAFEFHGIIKGDFPENSLPTDLDLSLKEGAQVVFIKNDPDHRWVNGTVGRVSAVAADLLEVTLESGATHRLKQEVWNNIKYTLNPKTKKIDETVLGSFTQYPVKLAWALTVHKSQGLTFNNAIIDLGHGAFAGGQTYVALSRCRSFEGMTLASTIADRDIFVNPSVTHFARSFNDQSLIDDALEKARADSCYDKARIHADRGELAEAFDMFIEGMRSRPILDNQLLMRFARRKLSVVTHMRERIDLLEDRIRTDSLRFADMACEYVSLGDDCMQDDLPLPAIANYDKALTLSPTLAPALLGRAKAYTMLEEYDKAVTDYRTLLEKSPLSLEAIIDMAECYMLLNDLHNALDRCMLALDIIKNGDEEYPRRHQYRLHTILADIYDGVGDTTQAELHRKIARRLRG